MYDLKQEASEFVADSNDEAIAKAARFYGVEADELSVTIPKPGEIFGQGVRAVVVAVPKSLAGRPARARRDDRGESRERGGRDRDRGDRGGRGGRGERGGRDRGRRRERGDRGDREEGRGRGRREARGGDEERSELPPVPEASKGTARGEIGTAGEFVLGVLERMNLGDFELSEVGEGDFVVCEVRGDGAVRLSAEDSRAIGAIQLLVNQAAMRHSEDPPRVVIDCEGDAEKRESFLERLAARAIGRARETGRSVALDPMNGRDRRAVHVAVRDEDGVATMSVGSGRYRQVVVVPEGADEYEEALEASEAASSRD